MKLKVTFAEKEMQMDGSFGEVIVASDGGYERGYADGHTIGYDEGYQKGFGQVEIVMEEIENGSY